LGGDDWWREVATFYIALSSDPKDVEHFIRRVALKAKAKWDRDMVHRRAHFLFEVLAASFRAGLHQISKSDPVIETVVQRSHCVWNGPVT
jgi:hypothetical protein